MIPPITPGQTEENQNMVSWKNTFSMRQISLMNLAASHFGAKNGNRSLIPNYKRTYSITSPAKSLDLLRKNLQSAINKDIDNIIKKYLEKFFQPAINNIKTNLGKESVSEEHVKEVCKQMLEEAKLMYQTTGSRDSSPYDYSDSEASTTGQASPLHRKRKESDTDSETNGKRMKYNEPKSKIIKRDISKWHSERITENTLFIMGPRANKVLGYGQTRGRLYARHPDLIRYSGDQEDKEWLSSKSLMPPSGGKAYLMVLEDIKELAESDEYKNNPNLQMQELKGFLAPSFLLNKIKSFIQTCKTDRKSILDLFDFRGQSLTPPNANLDSGPSTPSESHSSSSKQSENNFINMSPGSNNSAVSGQSPVQNSGLMSPGTFIALANPGDSGGIMILKDNSAQNENSLSNILASHLNSDNSQDF